MTIDNAIIADLIVHSSDRLRDLFELGPKELISKRYPRVVSRKDLSLDNYLAELMLRACYKRTDDCPDFEEIVIRGSDQEIPTKLNPQVEGAVLIGIGGRSANKDFVAYDEHSEEGERTVDSASQVVFFRHLDKFKNTKQGVRSILPVLNEINFIDSKGGAGEGHLNQMVKDLHLSKFYKPGFIVEEYPPQWKRAIVDAALAAICIENKNLRRLEVTASGKALREVWKKYRKQREAAVKNGLLMPLTPDPTDSKTADIIFNRALGRTASDLGVNEPPSLFTPKRIWYALERVWGEVIAYFVMGFFLEAKLQVTAEFQRTSTMALDETYIPEAKSSLVYYLMLPDDLKPHRGIARQLNVQEKSAIIVLKDSHRYTMSIFKSQFFDEQKWEKFTSWLQNSEPGRWYIPFDAEKGLAEFILNGTRYYLGSEPSSLTKEDFIEGIKIASG